MILLAMWLRYYLCKKGLSGEIIRTESVYKHACSKIDIYIFEKLTSRDYTDIC